MVWMHSPELIIKAKLGQRREHVVSDPRLDHLFYEPEYERFIGQFPIDYKPIPFPKFTEAERRDFIAEYNSKIHAVKSIHPLEFNLMLDGAIAKATDASPYGGEGMDDQNQVKVILDYYGRYATITPSGSVLKTFNTQRLMEDELKSRLDIKSRKETDGLVCYNLINEEEWMRCFGRSDHPSISGFQFALSPSISNVFVASIETVYGGIRIDWFTHKKNINKAREIDAAIWRLLDAWNVAPADGKN